MTAKKIAIIGTAGVGKTTLLNTLFEQEKINSSYNKIEELARILCKEQGYEDLYAIKNHDQFRKDVLERQIQEEDKLSSFIADRSSIDCWAYWMRWSWNSTLVEDSENYYQKAKSQASKYDQIIFIPKMFETLADEFRWDNEIYQIQMERLLKSIIQEWELTTKCHFIKSKELNERAEEVLSLLN